MSSIPPSIRKFLNSGRGEIHQLEHEYHVWLISSILAGISSILLFIAILLIFALESNEELVFIRLTIGISAISNVVIFYIVFQETLNRRRYLLEIQRLMKNGLTFLDSIRRGFQDMFRR